MCGRTLRTEAVSVFQIPTCSFVLSRCARTFFGMASALSKRYESAADIRSDTRHVALETKAGLQLLHLPHSSSISLKASLRVKTRRFFTDF